MQMQTVTQGTGMLLVSIVGLGITLAMSLANLGAEGHASFNTNSDGVSWGIPVVTYVFLSMTSTGLALVGALGTSFGVQAFAPIAKRCIWASIATLIGGFTALALELGHPFRLLWAIPAGMQTDSPMFWMGVFYLIALVLLGLKFFKIHGGDWDSGNSKMLGNLSVVAEVAALGTLGAAFGMLAMRVSWYGSAIPLSFLVAGAVAGVAFAVFAILLSHGIKAENLPAPVRSLMGDAMPKLFAGTLAVYLAFFVFHNVSGAWGNAEGLQVVEAQTGSALFHLELWVGLVVPLVILLHPGLRAQANMQFLAAALVLVALFIGRYEYIVGGQQVPLFKGAWVPGLIEYTPSMTEWMVTGVGIFLALAVYSIGDKTFNLGDAPKG